MAKHVLDSSAVLALLFREPGHEVVAAAIAADETLLSTANVAEVAANLFIEGADPAYVEATLTRGPWRMVAVDPYLALRAGELVQRTRSEGLSLGDCICLALAARESATALTSDRAWARGSHGIGVQLIR